MSPCTTPISWLRLERHHLGELDADEQATLAKHLSTCAPCAAALAHIVEDEARELPPLETVAKPATVTSLRSPRFGTRTVAIVSGLAVAAVIAIAMGRRPRIAHDEELVRGDRWKGSDVSLTLVREDGAQVPEAGGPYRDGERFKALVTCPPGMKASFDLAVFEHGDAAFPLAQSTDLPCGNAVPLPGAFRVTGHERMTVCLVWQAKGALDREALRHVAPDLLPLRICKTLEPAP